MDGEFRPDFAIIDIGLPEIGLPEIDGWELMDNFVDLEHCRFIAVTG